MRRVTPLLVAAIAASILMAASLTVPARAGADVFGAISMTSASSNEQADYAHDPVISANGRYVAFDGSFAGRTGVFRRDLATGAVEAVAAGEAETPAGSAELPSISADGQYVSFTTTAQLVGGDSNLGPDVYVRNMSPSAGQAPFVLASAVDGSGEEALGYETSEPSKYGSVAAGRTAISADGNEVAFVTTAPSDLAGPGTPGLQVAVRELDSDRTTLVSTTASGAPVSGVVGLTTYGAVFSVARPAPEFPYKSRGYTIPNMVGASISADGSTVAWMGQDVAAQASTFSDEASPSYTEPLWRRIAPMEPTRRVTGGSDPTNPACAASGETALPTEGSASDPCQGPSLTLANSEAKGIWKGRVGDPIPQLSTNGELVAYISQAKPLGSGNGFNEDLYNELYVANMAGGLTRVQANRLLTQLASGDPGDPATSSPVVDLGMSPDGTQIAFTTQRTIFPLGSPAFVNTPAAVAGMVELFDVDLAGDTLTRVSSGFQGEAAEHPHAAGSSTIDPYGNSDGALSPSFSADGDTLSFSSTASNLVFGDGNTPQSLGSQVFDGSDAFIAPRVIFSSTPTPQELSPAPAGPPLVPAWQLAVRAVSRADGTVALYATVPGAGSLRTGAASAVRVRRKRAAHRGHARRAATNVSTRTVATATKETRNPAGGLATVVLKLGTPYAALAGKAGGLSSTVTVTFAAHGHHTLRQRIAVTFRRRLKAHRSSVKRPTHRSKGKARRR
jgi:Tol biopolymer transport system component